MRMVIVSVDEDIGVERPKSRAENSLSFGRQRIGSYFVSVYDVRFVIGCEKRNNMLQGERLVAC